MCKIRHQIAIFNRLFRCPTIGGYEWVDKTSLLTHRLVDVFDSIVSDDEEPVVIMDSTLMRFGGCESGHKNS